MRTNLTIQALLLAIAAAASISTCAYAGIPDATQSYLAQFAAIINDVLWADGEMVKQMQVVSRKLDRFYFASGHFPRTEEEQDKFRANLSRYILGNPYQPREIDLVTGQRLAEQEAPPQPGSQHPGYALALYFLVDSGMTEENIASWVHSPPESWKGRPGSIFVMTNGTNLYVMWPIGVDGLPVKDLEHGNIMRIISHRCHRTAHSAPQ